MADKGKKGKAAAPAPEDAPPPGDPKPEDKDQKPKKKEKSVQPQDEVGTRKGCRRYKWEFKDNNKEFWVMGHAEVKLLSLVSWSGTPGVGREEMMGRETRSRLQRGSGRAVELVRTLCRELRCVSPSRAAS